MRIAMEKGHLNIMPTLSPTYDIKSLIERYASIQFANKGRPSTSNGVQEYHSNCPFCGGTDRFIMRPELGDYSCAIRSSGCGRHGDCLDFLKEFMNMSHSEACEILNLEINADFVPSAPSQNAHVGNESPPNARWQETGLLLVERAVHALWSPVGKDALDYLHGRGLGDDIIKKKRIGFVPLRSDGYFYEDSLEGWGLDPEKEIKKSVKVANGILIPWFEGSTLWRLGIKRPGEMQSYGQVLGSGEGLFNVGEVQYDTPAMIVEGEICAMSVEQECGDLIACVATGSTTRARLNRWVAELGLASYVLQSFDEDNSGDVGAEYWGGKWDESMKYHPGVLKKCMRWSPYIAKDPNDILLQKYFESAARLTLREWVNAGTSSAFQEFFPGRILTAGMNFSPEEEKAIIEGLENNLREIHNRPFVLPPSGEIASVPSIPLARGEVPIRQVSLIEQGMREHKGKLLSREQAMNRTGQPVKPDFPCFFCSNHPRKKKFWAWTWSPLDNECICVECLSPANWSQRNMASTDNNNKTWHK